MTTYLTISLLLSSICGLAILLLRNAPARLRFYICLMILVSWLTPWQLLQFQVASTNTFTLPLNILSEFNLGNSITETQDTQSVAPVTEQAPTPSLTFYQLCMCVFAIGLILFFKDVVGYSKLHRRWLKHSKLDNQTWQTAKIPKPNCDIRRIKTQAPGMATGLTKPIIWLNSEQHEADKIRTIVLHELTHIRQHDTYWLWVINLVQRLFWWNPLIWFTARYARQQIELSCDEQCKKHLPEGSYQQQLIKLTLQVNKQQTLQMPAVLQMSGTPAFNLQRINKLNKEHKMKKRYVVVMASLLSLTGWIGFSNATVNSQQSVNVEEDTTTFTDVYNAMNREEFTEVKTLLDKLTNKIDSYDASDQAEIWRLHAVALWVDDIQQSQILTNLDKAIALEDVLAIDKLLPIIDMAQSVATAQERWDKQISYANKWFTLADGNVDKKKQLYLTAISHYKLKETATSIALLNELVSINESQGFQPEEAWLNMLLGNHFESENWIEVLATQEKLAMLYPTEKNQKQLENMSQIKGASRIEKSSAPF